MNGDLPVSFEFDNTRPPVAFVQLTSEAKKVPKLHEYFLAPSYQKNDDGTFTMLGYGLIHRSHLPTIKQLENKYGKGNF